MHHHFTLSEREALFHLYYHDRLSIREIARRLGRSHSSLSRELRRNQNNYLGYLPNRAQALAANRKRARYPLWWERDPALLEYVLGRLREGWSPELISMCRKLEGLPTVSHESIYAVVYSSMGKAMGWHRLLRFSRTRRKKRQGRHAKRTHIPGRVGIEHRPAVVDDRQEIGHWEADSLLFGRQKQGVSVALERASRYVVLKKLPRKTARHTNRALRELRHFPYASLTVDNGSEFAAHRRLPVPVYFCAPYHSWEKGSIEQVNGLLRQTLPRSTCLAAISQAQLDEAAERLNTRPRKCLNYQTPKEVMRQAGAFQS